MARALLPLAVCAMFAPPARGATLTVDEAVQMALDHSYSVDAAEAGEVKARAEATEAFLQFFPKLTLSSGYTRLDQVPYVEFDTSALGGGGGGNPCENIDPATLPDGWTVEMAQQTCGLIMGWLVGDPTAEPSKIAMGLEDNYFAKLSLEQVIFAGGAMHQSYAARRDLHTASYEQVRSARLQAAYDVETSFYRLLLARRAVEVTTSAEEAMDAYVADLQAIVDVGAGSRADLLAAQAQHASTRLDAMRTAHGASLAEKVFKVSIGLPLDASLDLVLEDDPAALAVPESSDVLLREALAQRPDLATLDANVAALKHLAGASWATWLPSLVVMGNLNWKNPNYSNEPEWYRSADVTVAASWTLWDRGQALTRHRASRAGMVQLHSQRELLAEMMVVELQGVLDSIDEAVAELEVARMGAAASEESYRLERERFEQGLANNTQLLASHSALSGARLSVVQAETQIRTSHAALRKALGRDPEASE